MYLFLAPRAIPTSSSTADGATEGAAGVEATKPKKRKRLVQVPISKFSGLAEIVVQKNREPEQ
jgi:hypothetical protein